MIGGGLGLALLLYAGVSLSDRTIASETSGGTGLADGDPVAASLTPVTFTQVSETQEDGRAVLRLSGIAEPSSTVVLLNRGETARQVRVTPQGVWTAVIDVAGPGMAVEAVLYDGPGPEDTASGVTSIRGIETLFRLEAPSAPDTTGSPAPALLMISTPGSPTRVVQSPFGGLPSAGPLSIAAIDYDDTGGVIVSGRSSVAGRVRLYVSNAAIGETGVGADGQWSYIAGSVMPLGEYDVRAELLSANGAPVVSVPFERLPALPDSGSDDGTLSVVIKPFRWQVRRSLVGGGMQSTVIFAPE